MANLTWTSTCIEPCVDVGLYRARLASNPLSFRARQMMAMAASGRRDQRPATSISTPQINAMMANRNPRLSVTIDEPPYVQLSARLKSNKNDSEVAQTAHPRRLFLESVSSLGGPSVRRLNAGFFRPRWFAERRQPDGSGVEDSRRPSEMKIHGHVVRVRVVGDCDILL